MLPLGGNRHGNVSFVDIDDVSAETTTSVCILLFAGPLSQALLPRYGDLP